MTTFDFSPLYRSTVGFDHLASVLNSVNRNDRGQTAYPPYNIELLEKDKYRITMAVAGFLEDEITIESEQNMLTVSAAKAESDADDGEDKPVFLHQGIAERNFKRQFKLEEHVKVVAATLQHGLLHIALEREVPEAMKPRQIPVNGGSIKQLLKSA